MVLNVMRPLFFQLSRPTICQGDIKCFGTYSPLRNSASKDFFTEMPKPARKVVAPSNKITIVGVGQVGMACAMSCLGRYLTSDLCLFDVDVKKAKGEAMDLQHGSLFLRGPTVHAANEISETANSKLIIVTAGARQKPGDRRPDLIGRNLEIFKTFVPEISKHSPNAIFLIVSNPVDTMTWITWKMSGFPKNRVIGAGTNLDTSRFRFKIAQKLQVHVLNTHGWIIGEHGDTSVPVWSGVNVAGVPLKSFQPKVGEPGDPQNWAAIHKSVIDAAYDVIALKGYTNWAVGLSVGQISESIMKNKSNVLPVTTSLEGKYGVTDEVFASIPAIMGDGGIQDTVEVPLSPFEDGLFRNSLSAIKGLQKLVTL